MVDLARLSIDEIIAYYSSPNAVIMQEEKPDCAGAVVGTLLVVGVLGGLYWLVTRKPELVREAVIGAKERAAAEAARLRGAYRVYKG